MIERTFAIIKPDAVKKAVVGQIIDSVEQAGFDILKLQKIQMSKSDAEKFYAIHKERPFFGELVDFMTSGPVIIMALQKDNAVKAWRDLMGDTNPAKAAAGSMRNLFGTNIGSNATHGSDAPETAAQEIAQFFPELT